MTTASVPIQITCPSWCVKHPENEPDSHQSEVWREHGLTACLEHDAAGQTIFIDHLVGQSLDLNPTQARALAGALVAFADKADQA